MRKQFTKVVLVSVVLSLGACSSVPMPFMGDKADANQVDDGAGTTAQLPEETHNDRGEATQPHTFDVVQPAVPVPPLRSGTQALFDRAISLLQDNKLTSAQVLFEEITLDQPELAGPWANLGFIYLRLDEPTKAAEAFDNALLANSKNCDALTQLGVMARKDGRFEEAEKYYLSCLQAQPMYAHARLNLGILYELYMGRLGEALAAYNDYQMILPEPDKQVIGWVMDLERRVEAIAKR